MFCADMTRLRITLASACAALTMAGVDAHGAAAAYQPGERDCLPPTAAQQSWLDSSEWSAFAGSVRVCAVRQARSSAPALLIVSVWPERYYADKPSGTLTVAMPKPLLFSGTGAPLGVLPANFPDDPPAELVLRFTRWQRGLPQQISLCLSSPAAGGDSWLAPLRYDRSARRYVPAPQASRQSGDCHGG